MHVYYPKEKQKKVAGVVILLSYVFQIDSVLVLVLVPVPFWSLRTLVDSSESARIYTV